MSDGIAFQDDVFSKGNHCWGCGNENPHLLINPFNCEQPSKKCMKRKLLLYVLYTLMVQNVHTVKSWVYGCPLLQDPESKYRSAMTSSVFTKSIFQKSERILTDMKF